MPVQYQKKQNVYLKGIGALAEERQFGKLERDDNGAVLVRLDSGLGVYCWDHGPGDRDTGKQIGGGKTGYVAELY